MSDPKKIFRKLSELLLTDTLEDNDKKEQLIMLLKEYNESLKAQGLPPIEMIGSLSDGLMTMEEVEKRIRKGDAKVINFFREIVGAYARASGEA